MRAPAVQVTEPGRRPLTLLVTDELDVGRDCNGLILLDAAISRRHLSISPGGASVLVADLGSLNGSTVDGRPILEQHRLVVGEVVRFGGCTLTLAAAGGRDDSPPPAAAAGFGGRSEQATSIGTVAAAVLDLGATCAWEGDAGTVTIVFSDIEGSTARAVEHDDLRWREVLSVHDRITRRMLARHHGTETYARDDGFMMCFSSARSALAFMVDVQRALAAYEAANPLAGLNVRAGAHTGEAVTGDDGDLFGRQLTMTSRVAQQAHAGEILVTSVVREIVEHHGDFVFGESRSAVLDGQTGTFLLHRVMW